ncbi:MAG: hypothetical protein LUH19_02375, partial [Lachnospiraceae bacterium]|nr:hypothetical protein [Lachnospiraceae bacterium]
GREVLETARKVLPLANMLGNQNNMPTATWAALADYLEIGEDLWRYRYCKSALGFTTDIYRMFGKMDANWLRQNGKVLEHRLRTVRYYLMEARKGLMEGEDAETALAYVIKASELLEYKEEDRNSLPRSADGLRAEMWVLFGELLDKAGKGDSVADTLDRTDRYWAEKSPKEIARSGDLAHYIRYCRGLALRARKRNDSEYMNRVVENLSHLVEYYTEDKNAALWPDLYDRLMDACRFFWKRGADQKTLSKLMTAMLPALSDKQGKGALSGEEKILLEKYALEEQRGVPYYGLDGERLPDEEWLKMVLNVQEDDCGKLRAGSRFAVGEMLRGRFDYAAKGGHIPQAASAENCGNYYAEGFLIQQIAIRINLYAEVDKKLYADAAVRDGFERLTPLIERWLQTGAASTEPFVAEWMRVLGMYADSLGLEYMSGSEDFGLRTACAREAISVLFERMEKMHQKEKLEEAGLPDMVLGLGEGLAAVKEQGLADLPDEQYIEVLKCCERAAAYGMHTDVKLDYAPAHEIRRKIFWTQKGAEVYRRLGDIRRSTFWYLEALRWFLQMRKQPAEPMREDVDIAWDTCRILLEMVYVGEVTDHRRLMEMVDEIAGVSTVACRLAGEEARMSEAWKGITFFRDHFTNKGDEDFVKISGYLRKVSHAYLASTQQASEEKRQAALKWLPGFLDACTCQIETLNIQNGSEWDEILQELHDCKVSFPEAAGPIARLIGQVAEGRKRMDTNIHYLAMQGVRDLSSEASEEDFMAYVEKRMAGMPSNLGRRE